MVNMITEQIKNACTFRVDTDEYDWFSYPDVVFEIILDAVPTREQAAIAVNALKKFAENYNKWHFLRPIHYVSDIDHLPEGRHPRGIYVHIDFGYCSAKQLVTAVKAIEATGLPIFRVALLW